MAADSKPGFLTDYNTEEEHAAQLGVTSRTLRNWRRDKKGPPFTVLGERIYYYRPSTERWLRALEQEQERAKGRQHSSANAAA
jgi:DNA-binding transcriptional MerR regulator